MKYLYILLLIFSINSYSFELDDIAKVLFKLESNNKIRAIGDNGKAYGILQIHKTCIEDVNRVYGTNYRHSDAFNKVNSIVIFKLYISIGISRYSRIYNKSPTEMEIVRMWNGGIYQGYKINSTIKYYNKYLKIKNKVFKKKYFHKCRLI